MSGGGPRFGDYSKAFSDNPEVAADIDLDKQVKKSKQAPAAEAILEGATHDSIGEYKRAQNARALTPVEPASGIVARLRRLLGR